MVDPEFSLRLDLEMVRALAVEAASQNMTAWQRRIKLFSFGLKQPVSKQQSKDRPCSLGQDLLMIRGLRRWLVILSQTSQVLTRFWRRGLLLFLQIKVFGVVLSENQPDCLNLRGLQEQTVTAAKPEREGP